MCSLAIALSLLVTINALTFTPSSIATTNISPGAVPTARPTSLLSNVPTPSPINGAFSRCIVTDTPLDIIFMIDSSGSVFDDEYKNWQYELDLVYDIVDNAIPSNSRVALINFSGCGSGFTFQQCQDQGRFQQMFHLSTYGSPNDLDAVLSTIDAISADDFLGGYTWTNEALQLALEEFESTSTAVTDDTNKMIVLITDGEPYPTDAGHEACKSSTGYVSDTLQSLRELGVAIVTVGIDIAEDIKEEYFDCISGTDFYFEGSFDSSAANGSPSLLPTPSPVAGATTVSKVPTQSQVQALADGDSPSTPAVTLMPTPGSTVNSNVSPVPTINGSPSAKPTPSPNAVSRGTTLAPSENVSPANVPTARPSIAVTGIVSPAPSQTIYPSPSPIIVEDLSDSIGDFICAELGSSRLIVPTPMPTGNIGVPTPGPTPSPTLGNLQGLCESSTELDIVFMVDSSGSVYDAEYNNWQAELDLVDDIVNSLPGTSRASLINFSGCGSSFTLTQCQEQGRLKTEFNLDTYGNDLASVSSKIEAMDATDFNGGFTWTDEALGLALNQFNTYSDDGKTKVIVLLTDGEPYPDNEGHEACLTSTDYESATLTALSELDVDIITIGIDISEEIKREKLDCVSDSYFGVSHFSTLASLSVEISSLICDNINGDFSTLTLTPTMKPVAATSVVPTPSPVSNPSSIKPTPSPNNFGESTRGTISNAIMAKIYINVAVIAGFIVFVLF